ncbi:MAG: MarR family transcriptional regulator, partial [Delftia acidovorans]|nr:MarR family transcriptional regulator [Delftia acidovorans]
MTPQDGYHFSDQIGHLLRRVYQRHTALFQQYIPDSQLTAAQFVVLCSVRDNSGSSLADIVKATVIDQATIRGVVDRLKQRELVQV